MKFVTLPEKVTPKSIKTSLFSGFSLINYSPSQPFLVRRRLLINRIEIKKRLLPLTDVNKT